MAAFLAAVTAVCAGERKVSGIVTDVKGAPLAGVEITVDGISTLYTATGGDGTYVITVPDGKNAVLHFHMLGFLSKEISLAEHPEESVDVVLEEDYMNLETVVVTGTRTPRLLKTARYSPE